MRRVFADGCDTVVTGCAGADYLGVIDHDDGLPNRSGVAVLAYVGRRWMGWALACCIRTVMAVYAVTRDCCVIESRW
jgi:hypothetical protein